MTNNNNGLHESANIIAPASKDEPNSLVAMMEELRKMLSKSSEGKIEFINECEQAFSDFQDILLNREIKAINDLMEKLNDNHKIREIEILTILNRLGKVCDDCNFPLSETIRNSSFQHSLYGYIYLIHAENTDRYKIGLTLRTPEERLTELNRGQSPYQLTLKHSIKVINVAEAESYFHDFFKASNVRGEWFVFGDINFVISIMDDYKNKIQDAQTESVSLRN